MKKSVKLTLSLIELSVMALLIAFDVFLPSVIIAVVGVGFLLIRKEKTDIFNKSVWEKPGRFILCAAGLGCALTVFDYALVIPAINHLTHTTQDMSMYSSLKGNAGLMLIYLAYSWILAAIVEETAYRGFFQNRIISLFSNKALGTVIAVGTTSLLFGFMHSEQGVVGMVTTAFDAIVLSVVRYRYKSIWASVLVHGFSNMIGIVTFYFTGPIYGLW
ncbi:MAG: type II CAAX endopeptidase family protein [Oscillospiraceae bacterium]